MSDQQDIPEDEALAAEYVLRLLDVEAARAFEGRLLNEPQLREQVLFWEAEFAALASDLPEEAPSPSIKPKLLAELNGGQTGLKRGWTLGWLAFPALAAAALAAFLVFSPMLSGPTFDPSLHATLISEDGAVHIEAGYAPDGNLFKVIPEKGGPATGRDLNFG